MQALQLLVHEQGVQYLEDLENMSDSNELEEDRVVYVAQDEQAIERPVQKCDFFFFFLLRPTSSKTKTIPIEGIHQVIRSFNSCLESLCFFFLNHTVTLPSPPRNYLFSSLTISGTCVCGWLTVLIYVDQFWAKLSIHMENHH